MDNYLKLNGQKIQLTAQQIAEIKESFHIGSVQLSTIPAGETFKIGKHELIVLEQKLGSTVVIRKDVLCKSIFSRSSNNYNGAKADDLCKEFAKEIGAIIGEDNILIHAVDLTSNDGLTDYGVINRLASLLTADQYRKYVYILDKFKIDMWWFLATAYSTPTHGYDYTVMCVTPSGRVFYGICDRSGGVRPHCILKSDILVSR